jgi:enoyl-CoA hydratase
MQAFYHFAKVSIAQVHGYCYGLHFQWTTEADITIASEDALFGHPAFRYIGPTEPTLLDWIDIMGIKKAKELVFTGRPFTANEMERVGLVNKVVPKERLEAEVNEVASAIAAMPIDQIVVGKHLFETIQKARGLPASFDMICMARDLSNYAQFEPSDFNLIKEMKAKGISAAIKERDLRYPPSYRFSWKDRQAKK